jgi:putative ABC transport system ATP-binding protein
MAKDAVSVISMKDITKIYHVGGEEVRALDRATMSVAEGEFVSVVGPSGSGKSTLMNIIGCLDVADSGAYVLDGQDILEYSEQQLARIRNRKIGFVFQNFNLLSKMTAEENVELPLIYQGLHAAERKERARLALERVGLADRSRHKPSELSGGQQQRVAVARALATNPAILLADEPTGNLDSKTGADIIRLFSELHEAGNTIVLITHDERIASLAQRSVHIMDGRVEEAD